MVDNNSGNYKLAGLIALIFLLVTSVGATLWLNIPPAPLDKDAPPDVFSAERAMPVVEEIAQKPHPLGTRESLRVEQYLVATLEEMGFEVSVQDKPSFEGDVVFLARNIFARLAGEDSTGAIAICAHYDSVPYGPGAADDAAGVAAIIEIARVLKNSPPLRNDVFFLITDGEEIGLYGPKAFLKHNYYAKDLKLVINYEARGHYGPSMMYLTYPGNKFTINNFIKGASRPVASSVMFDFANLLPTASDYYIFKEEGYPGFDLAFVGGLKYYHTSNDNVENLSRRSLQHHGLYGFELTRHFGDLDLELILEDPDEKVVYFNTIGPHMVSYSSRYIWPITILALILILTATVLGFGRERVSIKEIVTGIKAFILPFLAAPLLVIVPVIIGVKIFGPYALYNQNWYFAGFCLLAFSLFGFSYYKASGRASAGSLALSVLLLISPLPILAAAKLPFGSFILAWPMLFAALGLSVYFLLPEREGPWQELIIGAICAFPALVLIAPLLITLIETFTFLMGPLMLLLAGLMLGLAVILFKLVGQAPRLGMGVPAVSAALAVICFFTAIIQTGFSPERPKMNYLLYGANYSTGEAIYATLDSALDEWTELFFTDEEKRGNIHEFAPFYERDFLLAQAPLAKIDLGIMEVISDKTENATRHLSIAVSPGQETAEYYLWTSPANDVKSVRFNDELWEHDYSSANDRPAEVGWYGHVRGRFNESVILDFVIDSADDSFHLTIVEQSFGLPDIPGIPARPDWMIPKTNTFPVSWDFSAERFLSENPLNVLEFDHASRSKHIYARQDFVF